MRKLSHHATHAILAMVFVFAPLQKSYAWSRALENRADAPRFASPFSAPEQGSLAQHLADNFQFETLEQMEANSLRQATVREAPWSGWYWPFSEGALASRYADPLYPRKEPWSKIASYLNSTLGAIRIDELSPAEKYDLLMGDPNFTLTRAMIKNASHQVRGGQIEPWIGYCTGTAAASVSLPRPNRSVTLIAADGINHIEFRPDDVKALGSLLWSTGVFPFKTAGRACNEEPVRLDPVSGRAIDTNCREVNPATFHLTVVNQIGLNGRAPLMDADYGYEVWNHAIRSYSFEYFNPITNAVSELDQAKVRVADFPNDKLASFRAPGTAAIVGIEMKVEFVYVREPEPVGTDAPERDLVRSPVYRYDLELDASGRILGGEWHSRHRPDVLWLPGKGPLPDTAGDKLLDRDAPDWQLDQPIPPAWSAASVVGAKRSQPLNRVVRRLFTLASSPAMVADENLQRTR